MRIWAGALLFCLWQFGAGGSPSACCSLRDTAPPQELHLCTLREMERSAAADQGVSLVSYATPDILAYAAYSFAINSVFARRQGYPLHLYSPATGSDFMPDGGDQRWNRVKILFEILDPEHGSHCNASHVVWFDADLIFLDQSLRFEPLLAAHADADIVISAERHAETGVANTGCFIVKNSAWSRAFLSTWWTSFDKTQGHDQTFFDRLYKSLPPTERSHIAILPVNALNSMPPPMLLQSPEDGVLHLMGESTELRKRVFAAGLAHVCEHDTYRNNSQLGLTQPVLLEMALETWHDKLQTSLVALDEAVTMSPDADVLFDLIGTTREVTLQIKKLQMHTSAAAVPQQQLSPNQSAAILSRLHIQTSRMLAAPTHELDPMRLVRALNLCGLVGQDLARDLWAAGSGTDAASRRDTLLEVDRVQAQVGDCLERLLVAVAAQSRVLVIEMKALHLTNLGAYLQSTGRPGDHVAAEDMFRSAVGLMRSAQTAGANMHHALSAYQGLGGLLCASILPSQRAAGLDVYREAISLQDELLAAEVQWKQDHVPLALSLAQASLCAARGEPPLLEVAAAFRHRCLEIARGHPEKAALVPLLDPLVGELEVLLGPHLPREHGPTTLYRRRKRRRTNESEL